MPLIAKPCDSVLLPRRRGRAPVLPASRRPGQMPCHQTDKPHEHGHGGRHEQERCHRPSPPFSSLIVSEPPNGAPAGPLRTIAHAVRLRGTPMTPNLTAALEVRGQLDGHLPCLGAVAHLQSRANTPVQWPPPRMSQVLVEHLGIKGMLNAVTPSTDPIRPARYPRVLEEAMLPRQPFAPRIDILDGALSTCRHRGDCTLFAHHAGSLQHLPRRRRDLLDAPDQQRL
jgi:hypothetical protein